jgi:hypothetical protein
VSYGCGCVVAGRAVPRAPGESQSPAPRRTVRHLAPRRAVGHPGAPRRTGSHTPRHDGPFATSRATTDRSPPRAPRRAGSLTARPDGPWRGVARPDGPVAAYGAQGTGWGVSARSGRRPSQGTTQGTEPPDRGRTPPTPGPTHDETVGATPAPTGAAAAPQAFRGAGNCAKTPAPTEPAPEPAQPPEASPPTVKPITVPPPSRGNANGAPPCDSATSRTIDNPRPDPGNDRASAAR